MNVAGGCACNAGFSGAVEPATIAPFFNSSCKGTLYHSILNAVLAQCTVIHNYIVCVDQCFPCIDSNFMSFVFDTQFPRYKHYIAVSCPANSSGMNVAVGCACNAGFSGAVESATTAPFFNSSCKGTWYHSILNAVLAQCTVIHNYIVCSDQCFPCIDSNFMSFVFDTQFPFQTFFSCFLPCQ